MSKKIALSIRKEVSDVTRLRPLATPSTEKLLDPVELFLHLTAFTCPFGGEEIYYGVMLDDLGFKRDECGNWFLQIGVSTTCFMAHLDTASQDAEPINRYVKDGICKTDGRTILGADNRAGLTVLLHLAAKDVPGLYYLFVGEESGCIGSGRVAKNRLIPEQYTKAICFDRRGTDSVVTRQVGQRTCSDEFAQELCDRLNYWGFKLSPDPNGVYTDSREFADQIPECTNISIGYEHQHSYKEKQDLEFLHCMCEAASSVEWESLPVSRDPALWDDDAFDWDEGCYYGRYGSPDDTGHYHKYFSNTDEDAALEAMDRIIENFQLGLACDKDAIRKLVLPSAIDTADMIELLIDELQRHTLWGKDIN